MTKTQTERLWVVSDPKKSNTASGAPKKGSQRVHGRSQSSSILSPGVPMLQKMKRFSGGLPRIAIDQKKKVIIHILSKTKWVITQDWVIPQNSLARKMSNHPSFDFCLLKIIHKNPFTQPSLIGDESTRLIHPVLSAHVGNTIFNPSVEIHIVLRVELQSRGLKKKTRASGCAETKINQVSTAP